MASPTKKTTTTKKTTAKSKAKSVPSSKNVSASKSTKPKTPAKKSAPTPKRKEQELKNARPIASSVSRKHALSKEERKAEKLKQREQAYKLREKELQALKTGDQKYLPPRDKGEVKKYARELTDAKDTPLQYFLVVAVILLLLTFVLQNISYDLSMIITLIAYVYITISIIVGLIRAKKIKKQIIDRFGNKPEVTKGIISYVFYRLSQPKRLRQPKVGV